MNEKNLRKMDSNFAGQLEEAFVKIGLSMMSEDFAGKLLAFLLKYGGGMEAVTHHKGLNAGIMIAQQKFNIKGGETPTIEGLQMLQKYNADLQAEKQDLECEWLWEIYMRYDLPTGGLKSECPQYVKDQYPRPDLKEKTQRRVSIKKEKSSLNNLLLGDERPMGI